MKQHQIKNNVSSFLMTCSLLLLGLFLAFWLKGLYQQEVDRLTEKSSFIFINSIREAESMFFQKELLLPFNKKQALPVDSIGISNIHMKVITEEVNPSQTIIKFRDTNTLNSKMDISVVVNTEKDHPHQSKGALMYFLGQEFQDSFHINFNGIEKDSILIASINDWVNASPRIKDFPQQFKVIKFSDSLSQSSSILSETYQDLNSGQRYALKIDQFDGYIFKKILPQFLFSLFLFSITSLAFFFIYKNLKDQQKLTELKNELISNITHELKTPISTVGVAIEALQNFGALEDKERTKEYLDISQQELNRLSILVDKVLNTSLFEKSDFKLKTEEINLKELIQGVLNSMKLQFQNRKATVQFNASDEQFSLFGDRIHLTNVVYNLVDNALKYSPINPAIELTLNQNEQGINFSIQDAGLGISKEYQEKIFNKFFRVPAGNEHSIKGHGLGLNYVKQVIEKHRGAIQVQSELGKGTRFELFFKNEMV